MYEKIIKGNEILDSNFYTRDTSVVAKSLLGKALVKIYKGIITGGIIVETEAYYGEGDPASHAFKGITPRSKIMYGKAGIAYVYLCYGMYYLLNAVTEKEGKPGAVLIRAIEPVWGINTMKKRRNIGKKVNLTNGPGKLTLALKINNKDNGKDLTTNMEGITIFDYKKIKKDIVASGRVGIKNGREKRLRYYINKNKYVSV